MEALQWPDLNPSEQLLDELEHRLRARPSCPTAVPDFTNALLTEGTQIPTDMIQNVENLPRRAEVVITLN